jgi:hypothetical protein
LSLGNVFFIHEASRILVGPDADLVLHRGPSYMYMSFGLNSMFQPVAALLGMALPERSSMVLIYPSEEEERTLLHPLFVHELAHETVERENLPERLRNAVSDPAAFARRLTATARAVVAERSARGEVISDPEAEIEVGTRLDQWLTELLCDQLALAYVGPAYLFSAACFLLPTVSAQSTTHPPAAMRIGLLLAFMDSLGWRKLLKAEIPIVLDWLDGIAAADTLQLGDARETFVRDTIGELTPAIRQTAIDVIGGAFEPDEYVPVADQLRDRLSNKIPPAQLESGDPAGRREILLATWLHCFGLARLGDDPATLQGALADIELQQFFSTALEMSYVLEGWQAT